MDNYGTRIDFTIVRVTVTGTSNGTRRDDGPERDWTTTEEDEIR